MLVIIMNFLDVVTISGIINTVIIIVQLLQGNGIYNIYVKYVDIKKDNIIWS